MSAWELASATSRFVLPPGSLILLALLGLGLMKASPRFGRWIASIAVVLLLALSVPAVMDSLFKTLEPAYVDPAADRSGGAIVVLGGGSYRRAPEYGQDTVERGGLERVRYAVHLQKRVRKPILVSGGNPGGRGTLPEAEQMQTALREYGVQAAWLETHSGNTLENAQQSYRILHAAGIDTVYLVTHAWHMPRARYAFEQAGFKVIPAPMGYESGARLSISSFVPNARSLYGAWFFSHEVAGLAWYRLKFALAKEEARK